MKNINQDFENAKGKSILFLGRLHSLNIDEIKLFLDQYEITYTDTLNDDVVMFIESTMMSPLEEDIAYSAYSQKIPNYRSEQFEELYADALSSDSLLMSLKLSNNQERLRRLLQNTHLNNRLFLKLFTMYDWGEEGLFDNSENMEVCTLFAKRFYYKDRFDPATFYSPISIFEIAIMNDDEEVLEALSNIPDITVKQSRFKERRPTNIKQALATNIYLNEKTFNKVVRLNDKDIDYFLSSNPLLDHKTARVLMQRSNKDIKMALSCNSEIPSDVFEQLLDDENILPTLLMYQKINMDRFCKIKKLDPNIGLNEELSDEVIQELIDQKDEEILCMLCSNEELNSQVLNQLYKLNIAIFDEYLAANKNFKNLQDLYEKKERKIDISLGLNSATPMEILIELFNRDNFEINKSLALNESLPIEYLQQLQIDTRLLNHLKENNTFTQNILNNLGI